MRIAFTLLLLPLMLLLACVHLKVSNSVGVNTSLPSSFMISVSIWEHGFLTHFKKSEFESAVKSQIQKALASRGIDNEQIVENTDLIKKVLNKIWNEGPEGIILTKPFLPSDGLRLVLGIDGDLEDEYFHQDPVIETMFFLIDGRIPTYSGNDITLIWFLVGSDGKVVMVGKERGDVKNLDKFVTKIIHRIQKREIY